MTGGSRHNRLRRHTALRRSEKRMKRTALRRVGRKGATHEQRMDALRPVVFARSFWRCEVQVASICQADAHHAHHILPRGRGGPDTLENLMATCYACHDWIHRHPRAAATFGFLKTTEAQP